MPSLKKLPQYFILLILLQFSTQIRAHELWVDPVETTANMKTRIVAFVRVGQNFNGQKQYYVPGDINEIFVADTEGRQIVKGTIGDEAVFNVDARNPGLQILGYHTTPFSVSYNTFEDFKAFVSSKGLDWVVDEHVKRGLPATGFIEKYTRYAKALLTRGNSNGSDKNTGLLFELVALKNPYQLEGSNSPQTLPVQLFWKGKPFKDAQISVFESSGDGVKANHVETGEDGVAVVKIIAGNKYMLNAVQMSAEKPETGAVWMSHWASLTFEATAKQ